jgi:hypothetical protein
MKREVACSLETLNMPTTIKEGTSQGTETFNLILCFTQQAYTIFSVLQPDSSRGLLCYSDFLNLSPDKMKKFLDGGSVHNKSSCIRRQHRKTDTNSYILRKIRTYDPMFEQPKASSDINLRSEEPLQ